MFTLSGASNLNVKIDSTGTLIVPLVRICATAPAPAPDPAPIAAPLPPPAIAPMIAPMAAPPTANPPVRRLVPIPERPLLCQVGCTEFILAPIDGHIGQVKHQI